MGITDHCQATSGVLECLGQCCPVNRAINLRPSETKMRGNCERCAILVCFNRNLATCFLSWYISCVTIKPVMADLFFGCRLNGYYVGHRRVSSQLGPRRIRFKRRNIDRLYYDWRLSLDHIILRDCLKLCRWTAMNTRLKILYRVMYATLILLGPSVSAMTVWLSTVQAFPRPFVAVFIFGAAGLFGAGLWFWLTEERFSAQSSS
jgi:hypothetical protein